MNKEVIYRETAGAKSFDQPLFVLRYQKRRMILPMVACLFFIFFIYLALFVLAVPSTTKAIIAKLAASCLLIILVSFLGDMLLFKEIRLYRDRIVKEWKLIGTRELELAKVGVMSQHMPTLGLGAKCFFDRRMSPHWRWLMAIFHSMGITYKEHLADRRQVKQLNTLLAELSGRKVEEFEQTGTMDRLFKDEK